MTTARFLGLSRTEAARYSLLLAIIATSAVGFAGVLDLIQSGNIALTHDAGVAVILSYISALIVIAVMMKWLSKFSFTPFVIYRLILGVVLIGIYYIWPII
jgi:undecaprenyl-diphosphatase